MSYGKASFLLAWNGHGGAFVYQPTSHQDPWNGAWTSNIGHPTGPAQHIGVAWTRGNLYISFADNAYPAAHVSFYRTAVP